MPKFFVEKEDFKDGYILIKDEDAIHINSVLRMKINDEIICCDNNSNDYRCLITQLDKKLVKASILEKFKNENEHSIKVTLYQGISKGERMELTIQKCVEGGIDKIVPVITDYTAVNFKGKEEKKIKRWNKISESAAKQCGRGKIPVVENIMNFKDAVNYALKYNENIIFPYEKEEENSLKNAVKSIISGSIAVFIGPEGGFSQEEIQFIKEKGIKTISLGKRILRTETAGLVTLVIILYELEDSYNFNKQEL